MLYLSINLIKINQKNDITKNSFLRRIFSLILPKANPDYESKIKFVHTWLLEFSNENQIPNRELGLDSERQIIIKMPDNNNSGYWTDNNLVYTDFLHKNFNHEIIDKSYFEEKWNT
jgi:hypothetical protein